MRELDRVDDQVHQDLPQTVRVADDGGWNRSQQHRAQLQSAFTRQRLQRRQHIVQQLHHRHAQQFHAHAARLDLGQVQHVVDDGQQVLAVAADGAAVHAPLLGIGALVEQHIDEAQDGGHRRADLVAHVGQERALAFHGRLGRGARESQFLVLAQQFGACLRQFTRDARLILQRRCQTIAGGHREPVARGAQRPLAHGAQHAHRLPLLEHGPAARTHPPPGAVAHAHAELQIEGRLLLQVRADRGVHARDVLGVHVVGEALEPIRKRFVALLQHGAHPLRVPRRAIAQVPVPGTEAGRMHRGHDLLAALDIWDGC